MRQILEKLKVKQVVMHLPWNHSSTVKDLLDDDGITTASIKQKTKVNLAAAREVYDLAIRRKIPVIEPFAGMTNRKGLTILGPTKEFYQTLLTNFDFTPGNEVEAAALSLTELLKSMERKFARWLRETWTCETLQDPDEDAVSPENNSSVIFVLEVGWSTVTPVPFYESVEDDD